MRQEDRTKMVLRLIVHRAVTERKHGTRIQFVVGNAPHRYKNLISLLYAYTWTASNVHLRIEWDIPVLKWIDLIVNACLDRAFRSKNIRGIYILKAVCLKRELLISMPTNGFSQHCYGSFPSKNLDEEEWNMGLRNVSGGMSFRLCQCIWESMRFVN